MNKPTPLSIAMTAIDKYAYYVENEAREQDVNESTKAEIFTEVVHEIGNVKSAVRYEASLLFNELERAYTFARSQGHEMAVHTGMISSALNGIF